MERIEGKEDVIASNLAIGDKAAEVYDVTNAPRQEALGYLANPNLLT